MSAYRPAIEMTDREWKLSQAREHLMRAEGILSAIRDDDQGFWDRMCQNLRDIVSMVDDELTP